MTYEKTPANFSPRFTFTCCFVEYNSKVILLYRHENKSQGGRWGLPGGKVEEGEDVKTAIVREIKEEIGLDIVEGKLNDVGETFHHHGEYDFISHLFSTKLDSLPRVTINVYEHKEFAWKTVLEILAMPKDEIVEDLDDVCRLFYKTELINS